MKWGNQYMKAIIDPNCPNIEPKIGSRNSCGLEDAFKKLQIKKAEEARQMLLSKCDFKLKQYDCSYNKYLDANPGIKEWAELNPQMAEKSV